MTRCEDEAGLGSGGQELSPVGVVGLAHQLRRVVLALKAAGYETLGNTWIGDSNKASLAQKQKSNAKPLIDCICLARICSVGAADFDLSSFS
ncbi:hypothetical protein ACYG9Z_22465 [Mesorhizobium sp. RSR380A]|uniref:hypothetical protein n=1 Tax=unclassified Mesorhizobium TaxID=325217 RepID=UPI0012DFAF77|nr:hypothetical protein [Mesorhizobium sp. LNJC380A00]